MSKCQRCGAWHGYSGAWVAGKWWSHADIYYPTTEEAAEEVAALFSELPECVEAQVVDGLCQHCREVADE
ncbi:MAG: hypothetical protein EBR82_68485 [Caulobacteraceae bacterium]|nr:hypothetical protein [Caulobacteraceae bacterium]